MIRVCKKWSVFACHHHHLPIVFLFSHPFPIERKKEIEGYDGNVHNVDWMTLEDMPGEEEAKEMDIVQSGYERTLRRKGYFNFDVAEKKKALLCSGEISSGTI